MDISKHIDDLKKEREALHKELLRDDISDEEKNKIREKSRNLLYERTYFLNELRDRCGYYSVCIDARPGCGCSPSAKVSKGFDLDTYINLRKEKIDFIEYY